MVNYLLLPGRHLMNTSFQEEYLWEVLKSSIEEMAFHRQTKHNPKDKIDHVVFVVTSANQDNSRYNPVSFVHRAISIDRFARQYKEGLGVTFSIVSVPHVSDSDNYVEFMLKNVKTQTGFDIGPDNSVALSSTKTVISMFDKLGYAVLTAESDFSKEYVHADPPGKVFQAVMDSPEGWNKKPEIVTKISRATLSVWEDYPQILKKASHIWSDPILTEKGSLTETRNYGTYAWGMGHTVLMDLKYNDIKETIVPGKIVDEGCADGVLMVHLAEGFPDSDILGVELANEFLDRGNERVRSGEYGKSFVRFYQRNLMDKIFEDNSINTTLSNSTAHEIWSYGDGEGSLREYIEKKYRQTADSGRFIVRDVFGPEEKDQEVLVWLNDSDGSNDDPLKDFNSPNDLSAHLKALSTKARFYRFAQDYQKDMRSQGRRSDETIIKYSEEDIDDRHYFRIQYKDIYEFASKKDYSDNWDSEMNEEFGFWSFSDWKKVVENVGFTVIQNPNNEAQGSRAYSNPWIVKNRFVDSFKLYMENEDGDLEQVPYPVTNIVLVAEKR